jgi:glycine/D-amino acid oxidase-like deaminating enzyme
MKTDVLVIGAGVLGSSSAYHIKRMNPELGVTLIDKEGGPGQGNTAKCAGGFRNLFTTINNNKISESTINWFSHLQEKQDIDIGFHKITYLYLLSDREYRKRENAFKTMESMEVKLRYFEADELRSMIPDLVTDFTGDKDAEIMGLHPITKGVQGLNCGIVDADKLTKTYETLFQKLGGKTQYNTKATRLILKPKEELGIPGEPFVWQEKNIKGVETTRGVIEAETTVVACGVWSERLLDPIGLDSMMRPKRRMIFVFDNPKLTRMRNSKGFNKYGKLPMTQLPDAGLYIKNDLQENNLWLGITEDLGTEYKLKDDPEIDENVYTNNAYYALVKYLPCFKDIRPTNMWAGQRAINNRDKQPVITSIRGLIYAGAATGNGILKSDSIGRIVASLRADESEAELFDGRRVKVNDFGIKTRNVGIETF